MRINYASSVSSSRGNARRDGISRVSMSITQAVATVTASSSRVASVALDKSGNLFASGYTSSTDFPSKNAVQPRFGGGIDAFLLKVHISDWSLLFSTYLGGSKMDGAYSVSLDSSGNPIISGVTESVDFPATPSAYQTRLRGSVDAFVTKLRGDGTRILWSTY